MDFPLGGESDSNSMVKVLDPIFTSPTLCGDADRSAGAVTLSSTQMVRDHERIEHQELQGSFPAKGKFFRYAVSTTRNYVTSFNIKMG
jgi:hypothetical protein